MPAQHVTLSSLSLAVLLTLSTQASAQSAQNSALCDQQCNDGIAAVRQAAGDANLTVPACQ